MMYIVTFYSHYDAMIFNRSLRKQKVRGTLRRVLRDLSSSCGTCVYFECEDYEIKDDICNMEAAYMIVDGKYVLQRGNY